MKKIIVACDSFKGSLSSKEIADIFLDVNQKLGGVFCVKGITVADGGEGTLDALLASGKFKARKTRCLNPLFEETEARYAYRDGIAVIETAECSGLTLIEFRKGNAKITTTYGTGETIRQAILDGAKEIYVCVGGSATNDGGIGALSALGYEFIDKYGKKLTPVGKNLIEIADVRKTDNVIVDGIKFTVIADVTNPLLGPRGATMFYGRQKGATDDDLIELENGMENYARVTEKVTGVRLDDMPGSGAAGGLAGGLTAYLGADIKSGIESVFEIIDFYTEIKSADIIVTGEGKIDAQSLCGKVVDGVCSVAKRNGQSVYVIAGCSQISSGDLKALGVKKIETLIDYAPSTEESIKNPKPYAYKATENLLKFISENE